MNLLNNLKGNKLYSILTGTCPVCHEESMYKDDNPYHVSQLFDMHERCSNCHTKYKMEPSFFFGAMYVSYAVGIAFAVPAFVIPYFFLNVSLLNTFFIDHYQDVARAHFTIRALEREHGEDVIRRLYRAIK